MVHSLRTPGFQAHHRGLERLACHKGQRPTERESGAAVSELAGWATSSGWRRRLAYRSLSETSALGQADGMGIGVGIFLIVVGAILTFAVDWTVSGLDLKV